jgi:hypothetical protein
MKSYEKSLKAIEDTLKLLSSKFGPFHRLIGAAYHNMGILQTSYSYVAPNASVAEKFKILALQSFCAEIFVARKSHGDKHHHVAALHSTIGIMQIQLRMFSDAITSFNECLRIQITLHGQNHPFVAKINTYLLLDSSEDGL